MVTSHRVLRSLIATMLAASGLVANASNLYALDTPFIDDGGHTVRLKDWSGTPALVTMEYSACRFVCSGAFVRLKELQELADINHTPMQFIVVSLDPKNDTPQAWTEYRAMRGLHRSNWRFLTPRPDDLPKVAARLDTRYWYADDHLVHDFRVLRVDGKGEVVRTMTALSESSTDFMQ